MRGAEFWPFVHEAKQRTQPSNNNQRLLKVDMGKNNEQ